MTSDNGSASLPASNRRLYAKGSHYAGLVALRVTTGVSPPSALTQVAADLGLGDNGVRRALRFAEAVDVIAQNVGAEAKEVILTGHGRLWPSLVIKISHTDPGRQGVAMEAVAQGRHPFAKAVYGTDPAPDALGFRDYSRRFSRSARVLDCVTDALAGSPAADRPTPAKSREAGGDLAAILVSCSALRDRFGPDPIAASPPPPVKHPGSRRRSPPPWHPKAFNPGRDLGFVAGVRGLLDYAVRHLPVLHAGGPLAVGDLGVLRGGLRDLDSAARRLATTVRSQERAGTSRPPRGRRHGGGIGPPSPGTAEGVSVKEAPGGPENKVGTYAVIYVLSRPATVTVKSGLVYPLPAGWYAYIGTMFGSGGVRARVKWHLDPMKDPQKNIDFLKPFARPVELWWTDDEDRQECRWSAVLAAYPEYHCPGPMFGATDCKICPAHLYLSRETPSVHGFARRLGQLVPGHATVYYQSLAPAGEVEAVNNFPQAVARSPGSRRPSTSGAPPRPASAPEAERP